MDILLAGAYAVMTISTWSLTNSPSNINLIIIAIFCPFSLFQHVLLLFFIFWRRSNIAKQA